MMDQILSAIIVVLIRTLIAVYTYITLPFYYIIQKPWKKLERANATRAVRDDRLHPYSIWRRVGSTPKMEAFEVETIDQMLYSAALYRGKKYPIAGVKVYWGQTASYEWFNYGDIIKRIGNIAKGLQLIGVEKGEKVVIFAETRLEWMLCAFAIYRVGATLTTLIAQLGNEGIIHIINQIEVKYAITTKEQSVKLLSLLPSIPSMKKIVDIDGLTLNEGSIEIISLAQIEINGYNSDIELSLKSLNKKDDIAVIMYTSGTTGNPKGVMGTHGQMLSACKASLCIVANEIPNISNHCYAAYLPLGHIFEFAAELLFIGSGVRIGYVSALKLIAGAPGLKPGEIPDIKLLKPTYLPAVPLVLDRIKRGVVEEVESKALSRRMFKCLMDYKFYWRTKGYNTPICNYFLCKKAREQLGGNLKYMIVGGAPMSPETEKLISLAFDVILLQAYGCTEVCGPATFSDFYDLKFGRTGAPIHGINLKLVDWPEGGYLATDRPNPRGEIVVNGDNVSDGYYLMDKETAEAFRYENGFKWYYTGDIGEVESDGSLKIIDRKKDLLKLQNGEYFSLGKIEAALKSCPLIDNICVHGSSTHDFLIALVVPNRKNVQTLAKRSHLYYNSFEELCKNDRILYSVSDAINAWGKQNGLSNREIPATIMLCPEEWTPDNGLLTAALKLKRVVILNKYKKEVMQLFCEDINNNIRENY